MSTSSAVHSNAFNFMGFLQHCVDPRTGQYTVSVDIPELKTNRLCGPTIPLQLQFNPLNELDTGFGMGWNLNLSQFTPHNNIISLSTGENFMVTGSGEQPAIKEKKLDSFHFHNQGNDTYRVVHKSGLVETLVTGGSNDQRVALPREIRSPSGHAVTLTYTPFRGGQLLSTISDAFTTLFRIERDPNDQFVKLHLHPYSGPDGEPLASFEMKLNDRAEVTKIILPTDEQASWRFSYERKLGRTCLVEVQTPVGGRERIYYLDGGHTYPSDGSGLPRQPLPRVTRHRTDPGFQQPEIVVDYSYSVHNNHNFLGSGASMPWFDDGLDNLYRAPVGYIYGSVATLKNGPEETAEVVRTVTRTFNRFHLMTEERTQQGDCIKTVSTEYHAQDVPFDNQPPQFQLPKTVTTRWSLNSDANQTRTEVESSTYDEFGNLTELTLTNGIRETSSYYPKEATPGCPADPEGFVRNLKEKTVYPADSEHGSAAQLRTLNTYQALPALTSAPGANNWLVVTEETLTSSDDNHLTALQHTQRTYNNQPDKPELHGRPNSQSETFNQHTTTTEFEYSTPQSRLAGETVDQTIETLTGFDGCTKVVTLQRSLFTGKPLVMPDPNGVLIRSEYDALNRLVKETIAPGTPHAASREYRYTLTAAQGGQASQQMTDVTGIKTLILMDGLNRTLLEQCWMPGQPAGQYRKTYSAQYDAIGNLSSETEYDWLDTPDQQRDLELTSSFSYDDWGEQCRVVGPDGVAMVTELSPFGLKGARQTTWLETLAEPPVKSGQSITELNTFNKPDSMTRLDNRGQTVGALHYSYDGLGNCTEQQHRLSTGTLSTEYVFDAFGRMTSTRLPSGDVINRSFAAHSTSELPISLEVQPANASLPAFAVGTQVFDGLERLTELQVGPRIEQYKYTQDKVQPSQRISPGGQTFDYSYTLDLTSQPSAIRINDNAATEVKYTYDNQTALITGTEKTPGVPENTYRYDGFGHLQFESRADDSGKGRETHYSSSRHGRQITSTVADGFETIYDYDDCGRAKKITQGNLQVDFEYNPFGQLRQSTATHGAKSLVTEFAYDSLSRETQRKMTLTGQPVRTLTQVWYDDDHLQSREQHVGERSSYKETFIYDQRGRLEEYTCTGDDLPKDAYGNRITSQAFRFDALDNVTRCISEFADDPNVDVARFTYAADDTCQLIKMTHSHASYPQETDFSYDADGHMLNDQAGQKLSYNSQGRLLEVKSATDQPIIAYRYNGHDDLVAVQKATDSETQRFYQGYSLSHAVQGNTLIQCLFDQDCPLGQQQQGDDSKTLLLLTNAANSVVGESPSDGVVRTRGYSAYGEQPDDDLQSLLAFNGEMREEVGGWYLLGRGYRAYNPSLMRFHSPDSLSPFGGGGINPYMYCAGNPISFRDPTGHMYRKPDPGYVDPPDQPKQPGGWTKWLGVGIMGAITVAAAVGLAVVTFGAAAGPAAALALTSTKVAIGGLLAQVTGLVIQGIGVGIDDPNLNTAGQILWGIGLTTTIGGTGKAYKNLKAMRPHRASVASSMARGSEGFGTVRSARNPVAGRSAGNGEGGGAPDVGAFRRNSAPLSGVNENTQTIATARDNLRRTANGIAMREGTYEPASTTNARAITSDEYLSELAKRPGGTPRSPKLSLDYRGVRTNHRTFSNPTA
jgi:RHS repeat-associated protein